MKLIIFILMALVAWISGCFNNEETKNNKEKPQQIIELENITMEVFKDLGMKVNFEMGVRENDLFLNMLFIEGYMVDLEFDRYLFPYMLYRYGDKIHEFDFIRIDYEYTDFLDKFTITHKNTNGYYGIQNNFENPLFRELFVYAVAELNSLDAKGYDYHLNGLRKNADDFDYSGNFWDLLKDFSYVCCDIDSHIYHIMEFLHYLSQIPEYPIRPDVLENIMSLCEKRCQ